MGAANFTIAVPPSSAGSQTMASAVVTLLKVNSTSSQTPTTVKLNLLSSTHGCVPASGGGLTCVARISVPPGSDTFSVTTYSLPNGTGTVVTSDLVTTSITAGKQTNCAKATPAPAAAATSTAVTR
jgi:hypothetical protein